MNINAQWLIDRLSTCAVDLNPVFKEHIERLRMAVASDTTPRLEDVSAALIGALIVSDQGVSLSALKSEVHMLRHECTNLRNVNARLHRALHKPQAPQPARNIPRVRPTPPPVEANRPKPISGFGLKKQDDSKRLNQKRSALGLPTGGVVTLEDGSKVFKLDNL